MPFTKNVICLANSRKLSGFCVAGKELLDDKIGEWIRQVSKRPTEELNINEIRYKYWKKPKLLDIISIPLLKHNPNSYQAENYLIDDSKKWVKIGALKTTNLQKLRDDVDSLWINGYHSHNGFNDRIPEKIVTERINSSLLFINPDVLSINVRKEYQDKRKVRANFKYKEKKYILMVTDPVIENIYLKKEDGKYKINKDDVYLCISLGGLFEGYAYKLVAGIINYI